MKRIEGGPRPSRHDRALNLLDREREVLLAGPTGDLASVVAAREALVSELLDSTVPPPEGFLVALRSRAERNSRLLLASLAGLNAARQQIEQAEAAASSLKTYDATGAAVEVGERRNTQDRRR
jgi:hypothetical protein